MFPIIDFDSQFVSAPKSRDQIHNINSISFEDTPDQIFHSLIITKDNTFYLLDGYSRTLYWKSLKPCLGKSLVMDCLGNGGFNSKKLSKIGHLVQIQKSLYVFGPTIEKLNFGILNAISPPGQSTVAPLSNFGYVRNKMGLFTTQERPHSIPCSNIDPDYPTVFYVVPDLMLTWEGAHEHCLQRDHALGFADSEKTHDRIKGILHPGTFWIGIRYENGKYFVASDQANQYHGYLRTKPDPRGPTIQCAYINIEKFYTNEEHKIIEANWKWGPCNPHRFFICEVQHDKVDYSMTPCPDCFYPDKERMPF